MVELSLKILKKDDNVVCTSRGIDEVNLVSTAEYEEGDRIILESSKKDVFLFVQVDDALGKAFILYKDRIEYVVPYGEKRFSYSPKVFYGNRHLLSARVAREEEIKVYKNLALNVMDQHENSSYFPHVTANVETRGESKFAARNAIDGVTESRSHGSWPYESWGINMQDDAAMKMDFGRSVSVDRIVLYLRADFPHDNWWEQVTIRFSDGSSISPKLEKSELGQVITFEAKTIEWLELCDLIKADDPSPFPALTQIEVYGVEK